MIQPRHIVFDRKEKYGSSAGIITRDGLDQWLAGSETPLSGGWNSLLLFKNPWTIPFNYFRCQQNDSPLPTH